MKICAAWLLDALARLAQCLVALRWRGAVGRSYSVELIFWKARLTYAPSPRSRCVLAVRVAVILRLALARSSW
jgi:hypothetical protein